MKVESTTPTDTENVLCYLTDDWKTRKIESARSKGETLTYRYGVAASLNSWTLTEYRSDLSLNHIYASSFADLAPSFRTVAGVDPMEGMQRVIASLEKLTGKKITINLNGSKAIENAIEMGRQVDALFQVDYAIHDKVRERIFGESSTEEE